MLATRSLLLLTCFPATNDTEILLAGKRLVKTVRLASQQLRAFAILLISARYHRPKSRTGNQTRPHVGSRMRIAAGLIARGRFKCERMMAHAERQFNLLTLCAGDIIFATNHPLPMSDWPDAFSFDIFASILQTYNCCINLKRFSQQSLKSSLLYT